MAADVVRITFKELEEIANRNERSKKSTRQTEVNKHGKNENKQQHNEQNRRSKRPTMGIYQPPSIARHKQQEQESLDESVEGDGGGQKGTLQSGENWDYDTLDLGQEHKESIEKEVDSTASEMKKLNVKVPEKKDQKTNSNENRRRSKRPEIQRYVPKGKILEQQSLEVSRDSEEKEDWSDDDLMDNEELTHPSSRKTDEQKRQGHGPVDHEQESPAMDMDKSGQKSHNVKPRARIRSQEEEAIESKSHMIERKVDLKSLKITVVNDLEQGAGGDAQGQEAVTAKQQTVLEKTKSQSQKGQGRGHGIDDRDHGKQSENSAKARDVKTSEKGPGGRGRGVVSDRKELSQDQELPRRERGRGRGRNVEGRITPDRSMQLRGSQNTSMDGKVETQIDTQKEKDLDLSKQQQRYHAEEKRSHPQTNVARERESINASREKKGTGKVKSERGQELYVVPSRPSTIGQEAHMDSARQKQTVSKQQDQGRSSVKQQQDSSRSGVRQHQDQSRSGTKQQQDQGRSGSRQQQDQGRFGTRQQQETYRFNRMRPNKAYSRSFDKLNEGEVWEDDLYPGPSVLDTMVFERSQSSDQLNLGDRTSRKAGISRSKSGGVENMNARNGSNSAAVEGPMRRSRTGSFSSDISTGSDLSMDDETHDRILDWSKEVERELALKVQDEAQKLNEWFEKQSYVDESGTAGKGKVTKGEKKDGSNRPNVDKQPKPKRIDERRGRRKERRRGSLDIRSRESSVASAASSHSVQSAYGEDDRKRRDGRRRRKKNRSSSSNYRYKSGSSDQLNITVTCAQNNKREVVVDAGKEYEPFYPRGRWGREDRRDRHRDKPQVEGRGRGRGSRGGRESPYTQEIDHGSSPKGGGLLHLPPQATGPDRNQESSQRPPHQPYQHPHQRSGHGMHGPHRDQFGHHGHHDQGHDGHRQRRDDRGGDKRVLFDPKNPRKPIIISKGKLEFRDTDSPPSKSLEFRDTESPSRTFDNVGSPPSPNFPGQEMPMRPYPQFYPPQYGYGYPPRGMPPPTMEGMYYPYPVPTRDSALYQDDTYSRDPYYHSGYEPEPLTSGHSRSQNRMMAEHLFREAVPLDIQLSNLLSRRIHGPDALQMMVYLRAELISRLERVIMLDPDLANKHNVEQLLWKSAFYQVVEVFRKQITEDNDEDSKIHLHKILEEGTTFYEVLLEKLQSTFQFQLDKFLDTNALPPENLSRTVKLALLSAQRTMICLGDIARYREQTSDTGKVNYGKARNWYSKAQQIAPKNGRPYNQLAILALYTRRKLDAVYYYMRSLAASNPFLTARESLMSLFNEVRKKAEAVEKKRLEQKSKFQKLKQRRRQHGHRIEIWVSADGSSSQDQVDENYEEDLSKLEAVELNKRFVLSFLHVHGKLFGKIGMETFGDTCSQMLKEFQALLQHGAIGPSRLLQLVAINMFAIENTALKDESLGSSCRSLLQEYAVQMGLDMFGILVGRCSEHLTLHMDTPDFPAQIFSEELEEMIPGVKVWIDWMICHSSLWNPPPAIRDPSLGPDIDVWLSTAKLCNILKDVDTSHIKFYSQKMEGCEAVILPEDTTLAGFVPLLGAPMDNCCVHSTVEKEIAKDCHRVEKLKMFGEYLCGIEPPMLAYDVEKGQYYSVAPSQSCEDEKEEGEENGGTSEGEDVVIEEEEEEVLETSEGEDHVQHLRAKKEELTKKMEEHTKQKENIQKLLETNRHGMIELEIHPIFLVPDTNCFIDHLPNLKTLVLKRQYTIVIPLIVINELDGLAQGSKEGQYESSDHAQKVKHRAKDTVVFLEEEFEKKNSHLKALTAKGSVMETIAFRSEETDATGNNDDVILSCCLHYCNDKARDFMPKDKEHAVRLYREVVLLTDDRNLRLKAHTCNVPVKDVLSFIKWSKVT